MRVTKWYFSTWFIAVMFALWFLIIPLVLGILLISKQKKHIECFVQRRENSIRDEVEKLKEELYCEVEEKKLVAQKEIVDLENKQIIKQKELVKLDLLSRLKFIAVQREIQSIKDQSKKALENETFVKTEEISKFNKTINRKKKQLQRLKSVKSKFIDEIIILKDEILFQNFGFYDHRYDLENSQEYKELLEKIRKEQKEAVKNYLATNHSGGWLLNNSQRKGAAMNNKNIKLAIRSFNNECDIVIHKVKFNNIESSEKKIRKAKEQLDKLNSYNQVEISEFYLNLKLQELFLAYEYAKKKNDEREELRHRNELLREELRAQKEIEARLNVLLKEQQHYQNALDSYLIKLENAKGGFSDDLKREIEKIENELKKIEVERADLDYRVRNAKAGFVYVISNLGAFGDDVFKIGMTRRLEPIDRIRELSGASVPFHYDVHAMIFAEDAPALENELHKAFNESRVNKVNSRKEFFRVSLKEIEKVVREKYNKPVEFTRLGIAQEYRETMMLERDSEKKSKKTVS